MEWGNRKLVLGRKTYVMGIVNCTPDSFYPGSRRPEAKDALGAALRMAEDGADVLDVGGESSRPGADPVSAEEEIRRVIPVIREIRAQSGILISVDTWKKAVAERALDEGADMINDITALRGDPVLPALAASRGVPVILMHMRGSPKTMQKNPSYADAVSEIFRELSDSIKAAVDAGISRGLIFADPGIGFGKRVEDNLRIIGELASFKALGVPLVMGISRKSFLGEVTGRPVEGRLAATTAANALAAFNGADILRVHDVPEAVDAARVADAVRGAGV